jgi:hypothetical protein
MKDPENAENAENAVVDQAVSDPADKKAIRTALKDGTTVWCLNNQVCRNASPCDGLACSFKGGTARPARVAELAECGQYEITTVAERYEAATPLFPYSR